MLTRTLLLSLIAAVAAMAVPPVPEIDPVTGVNAITLLGGAALVVRSLRRK